MATDPYLLDRIHNILQQRHITWSEKRMFGGDCFMINDKMCFASINDGILARVGPEQIEILAEKDGAEQMIHGGRVMTGYMLIKPEGFDIEEDLEFWIEKCLEFNPKAKSSKKKTKK